MYDETLIKQIIGRVEELEQKMFERERQQITYPLDAESLPPITQHYVRKISQDTPIGPLKVAGIENVSIGSVKVNSVIRGVISVGAETIDRQGGSTSSLNTQLWIEDQPSSTDFNSFLYSYRKPLYSLPTGSTVSVTSGASTMTDTTKTWVVNELAGAMVNIYNSSGVFQFTRQIASNTSTVVTIDSTWPSTVNGGSYIILVPTYLGAAEFPWRRVIVGGDDVSSGGDGAQRRFLRMGYGTTTGSDTLGMFFGTGSPAGVVTANRGSLYLRTDGDNTSTLYAKTSADGTSGGWSVIT